MQRFVAIVFLIVFVQHVTKAQFSWDAATVATLNPTTRRTDNEIQSTQSPNDLLNEFLLHLNLQQSKVNGQNTNRVNNGTLTTSHDLTHLELNRSLPSLRIDRSSPSNHSHSLMGCNYDGERRECGYPGIIPTECTAKGCCWDHSTNVGPWCFHADGRNFYNTTLMHRTAEAGAGIDNGDAYQNVSQSNSIFPSLNSTTNTNESTTPETSYSLEEQEFLSLIEAELHGLYSVDSTLQDKSVTRLSNATTATMKPAAAENLPRQERQEAAPYLTSNETQSSISPDPSNSMSDLEDLAALLNYVEELERQRARTSKKKSQTCSLSREDSCCRVDPTSPCCELHEEAPLPHRSAPVTRIVGGAPAGSLRRSMVYLSRGSMRKQFCGGTLIQNKWVLTAAHCVREYCYHFRPASELVVSLGKYHKAPFHKDVGQQDIQVRDVICHPNQCKSSDSSPRLNDVALLRLRKPAVITQYVSIALLPELREQASLSTNCIAMGWGRTRGSGFDDVLKQVSVPVISNKKCNLPRWRNCIVKPCMLCAGDINIDPCDGDSGGPLFCPRSNGLYVLHGIYSWGRCGVDRRKPSIYMRTSYFVDWIARILNEDRFRFK